MTAFSNTVERAYQLARSGEYASIADIRARLRQEGCEMVSGHLAGRRIQQDLREILRLARPGAG